MLTLEIAKIPPEGLELDSPLDPREVHVDGESQFQLLDGGRFKGRVERSDENSLHVRGRVDATMRLDCGRCLEPFELPLSQELELFYLPHRPGVEEAEDEVELSDRDMVVVYYQGERVDLGDALREQLFLALPLARACGAQCRGLCPVCGVNRNATACTCESQAKGDVRLVGLAALLEKGPAKGRH